MGEEEARELLRHFLATIPDHRLSELEDGNMIVFEEYLFDSDDQSINDEHTRVLSANAPSDGPDSSLEISPNKKRSIPGNDLCPKVWDEPLMAVTSQGKKSIWKEFRKFCKDDDIPGETLSILTIFRVEEPFHDPAPPPPLWVAETPDLISRCHPETPYDDDRPKADRRTDGDWVSEEVDARPNAVDNDMDVDKPKETLQNDERPSAVAIMLYCNGKNTSSVSVAFPLQAAVRRSLPAKGKTFSRESELRDDFRRLFILRGV